MIYQPQDVGIKVAVCLTTLICWVRVDHAAAAPLSTHQERTVEWTVTSQKTYADPFNDVDVDVILTHGNQSWRVPTFWRGQSNWTMRFAPPVPGEYAYRLQST